MSVALSILSGRHRPGMDTLSKSDTPEMFDISLKMAVLFVKPFLKVIFPQICPVAGPLWLR